MRRWAAWRPAPTYNRLTWNFTNGEGEVAYVTNYNIDDINLDGFINEADAAIMYPQGHGDAYGQQLTALTLYYQLLRHPNYTWVPRAEPVSVAGAPVVVDYYDERRFAAAAAARARMGAEVVNLTYRKNYAEPDVQPYRDTYVDSVGPVRHGAWRPAATSGPGAWPTGPAARPRAPTSTGWWPTRSCRRSTTATRTSARSTGRRWRTSRAITDQLDAVQTQLDRADQGVNPLGLTGDAVLFDLDPALTKTTPATAKARKARRTSSRSTTRPSARWRTR